MLDLNLFSIHWNNFSFLQLLLVRLLRLIHRGSIVPSLPPSYPGTIIGGTGLFVGAVGYVDVTTITGSTLTPLNEFSETINANFPQAGYITQKINVVTNVPLPVAP